MPIDVPFVWFVSNYLADYGPYGVSLTNRCQYFSHSRAAESCANFLACLYWQGRRAATGKNQMHPEYPKREILKHVQVSKLHKPAVQQKPNEGWQMQHANVYGLGAFPFHMCCRQRRRVLIISKFKSARKSSSL
jgi:hypothetical protein